MADKVYRITFELSDGTTKTVDFTAPQGPAGQSAYELAVELGFQGTEEEWIASLNPATSAEGIPADKVMFDTDLVFTEKFGKYEPVDGKVTVPAENKSWKAILLDAYSEDKNPSTTDPTVTISSSTAKAYEVGTRVSPAYSGDYTPGSYTYGPDTGVIITKWEATNNVTTEKLATQTGTFAQYTVPDGANYTITVKGTHSDGTIPKTALGADYEEGQITSDTLSATSGAITGYRNSFYGTLTNKSTTLNSTNIRSLSQKSGKTLANGSTFTVNVPVGAMAVVIAYPATLRDLTSVKDVNGLNAEILSAFTTKLTVAVEGAGGYTAINYKVYVQYFASANDKANKYTVTI